MEISRSSTDPVDVEVSHNFRTSECRAAVSQSSKIMEISQSSMGSFDMAVSHHFETKAHWDFAM
jgi:hypothetical protein